MGAWSALFWSILASPRRFFLALGGIAAVVVMFRPAILGAIMDRFALAAANVLGVLIGRLAEPVLTILLGVAGCVILWRVVFGGGKKKRR